MFLIISILTVWSLTAIMVGALVSSQGNTEWHRTRGKVSILVGIVMGLISFMMMNYISAV